MVERAKREPAWKLPHARKGDTQWGERKMRDYRQSPSFWTNALLSQRKTLIGSSMEICQHLSKTRQPLSTLDIITITEQITRVALVEATKKKANPATDEVRVENRNHGLFSAWSQSENNRTVARLLSLFKSYHQGRDYASSMREGIPLDALIWFGRGYELHTPKSVGHEGSKAWALSVVPHFSLSPPRVAFFRVGWFSRVLAFET